ncbi:processed acidic surface protein [Metabacillus schmidteae]|uniref:processed acidic surface protein n=1 Tax=Metabacillus schmidteae TaxID=2730405 RepID=UPI00158D250D|nr:processed acidic surface protein [Metabacillus schmidteae]
MKKFLMVFIIFLSFGYQSVKAAPPQQEVNQILTEINWTEQQLIEYLDYYELTLDDFETGEDLRMVLGTPITPENLAGLLQQYEITRQEMDLVLAEFGETLEDYYFIEDLDVALNFYLDHEGEMAEIEEFLSLIGLTEEEVDALFTHFMELDEKKMEQQMENIMSRLDPYLMMDDMAELSEAQQDELISIFQEIMEALNLKAQFTLIDNNNVETIVTFKQLINMDELYNNNLLIALYSLQGDLILDMRLSEDMLSSEFFIESGIEFAELGDLAGELTNMLHNRLPDTASSTWINLLIGFIMLGIGVVGFLYSKKVRQVK